MASKEIQDYQRAVWDFMEDHATVTPDGKYRILFTTTGIDDFRKRIWARWVKRYKRVDPDSMEAERIENARQHANMKIAVKETADYNAYITAPPIAKLYYLAKGKLRRLSRLRLRFYHAGER